jgi:hypothetical protein
MAFLFSVGENLITATVISFSVLCLILINNQFNQVDVEGVKLKTDQEFFLQMQMNTSQSFREIHSIYTCVQKACLDDFI